VPAPESLDLTTPEGREAARRWGLPVPAPGVAQGAADAQGGRDTSGAVKTRQKRNRVSLCPLPPCRRRWVLVLDGRPASLNELTRGKRRDRIRLGKRDRERIREAAFVGMIPPATCKRRVRVTVVYPPGARSLDVDAVWKGLLDALACAGCILSDAHIHAELAPVEVARGERARCFVELEDL
jgi:hypothetical protein